jgi:hypothetical protein
MADIGEWEVDPDVTEASKRNSLAPEVINTIIQHESSGNPNAVSPTGPVGLMQLGKAAAQDVGLNPADRTDPAKNIAGGSDYYQKMVEQFGPDKAYLAYHDGPGAIAQGREPSPQALAGQAKINQASAQAEPTVGEWEVDPDAQQAQPQAQQQSVVQQPAVDNKTQPSPNDLANADAMLQGLQVPAPVEKSALSQLLLGTGAGLLDAVGNLPRVPGNYLNDMLAPAMDWASNEADKANANAPDTAGTLGRFVGGAVPFVAANAVTGGALLPMMAGQAATAALTTPGDTGDRAVAGVTSGLLSGLVGKLLSPNTRMMPGNTVDAVKVAGASGGNTGGAAADLGAAANKAEAASGANAGVTNSTLDELLASLKGGISKDAQNLIRGGMKAEDMTPGQLQGGLVKSLEDKATSLPFVGPKIDALRRNSLQAFNANEVNKALSSIGKTVQKGPAAEQMAEATGHINAAYTEALSGIPKIAPASFDHQIASFRSSLAKLPKQYQARANSALNDVLTEHAGDTSAEAVHSVVSNTKALSRGFKKSPDPLDNSIAKHLDKLNSSLNDLMGPSYADVNKAYAKLQPIKEAIRATSKLSSAAEEFGPAQLYKASEKLPNLTKQQSLNLISKGGNDQLAHLLSAKRALPSGVPDSGTAGRLMMGKLLGAAGTLGTGYAAMSDSDYAKYAGGALGLMAIMGGSGKGLQNAAKNYLFHEAGTGTQLGISAMNRIAQEIMNSDKKRPQNRNGAKP